METWFSIVNAGWLAFLACGAYLSFCFWKLSDEETARKAEVERHAADAARPEDNLHSFILGALD